MSQIYCQKRTQCGNDPYTEGLDAGLLGYLYQSRRFVSTTSAISRFSDIGVGISITTKGEEEPRWVDSFTTLVDPFKTRSWRALCDWSFLKICMLLKQRKI